MLASEAASLVVELPAVTPLDSGTTATTPEPEILDDEDDDLPPPLEGARTTTQSTEERPPLPRPVSGARGDFGDGTRCLADVHTNEAAEAVMQQALASHEQKHRKTEEARRGADMSSGGGLKKGFLSSKKKPKGKAPKAHQDEKVEEVIPYIGASSDVNVENVPQILKESLGSTLKEQSWVTPQLLEACQHRPNLMKGLANPKYREALGLMGKDPEEAMLMLKDDVEFPLFFKEFSNLMATHFDVLSKDSKNVNKPLRSEPSQQVKTLEQVCGAKYSPEVEAAFKDPEVLSLIAELQSGKQLEMHQLVQDKPHTFHKVKVLLDAGLLSMQH